MFVAFVFAAIVGTGMAGTGIVLGKIRLSGVGTAVLIIALGGIAAMYILAT